MRIAIVIILLLVAGCVVGPLPTETPGIAETPQPGTIPTAAIPVPAQSTPTREVVPITTDCPGYDASLELLTNNFCLDDTSESPYIIVYTNNVHQVVPPGFELYSVAKTINGYADPYSAHAPITCEEWGCTIDVHNGITGIDGIWGYSQTVEHDGCVLAKLTGNGRINDPSHPGDYTFNVYVNNELHSHQIVSRQGYFELVSAILLTGEPTKITLAIQIAWNVPGEGSEFILYGAGVYAVAIDWCESLLTQ